MTLEVVDTEALRLGSCHREASRKWISTAPRSTRFGPFVADAKFSDAWLFVVATYITATVCDEVAGPCQAMVIIANPSFLLWMPHSRLHMLLPTHSHENTAVHQSRAAPTHKTGKFRPLPSCLLVICCSSSLPVVAAASCALLYSPEST